MAVDDGGEGVGDVGDGIDAVQLAGGDDGGEERPVLGPDLMTGEQGVLARQGHHPNILPMSGWKWSFTTAGIRSTGVACVSTTPKTGEQDGSSMPRRRRESSSPRTGERRVGNGWVSTGQSRG